MTTYSPLHLLAALGALALSFPALAQTAASAAATTAPDTSKWTCSACPYPADKTAISGSVDVGLGDVSDASRRFGDISGLHKKGAYAVLDGQLQLRSKAGYYLDLQAADLGLDSRRLLLSNGLEGLYGLQLGYSELPRSAGQGAQTPFLGVGSTQLTLPALAGFPAAGTNTMPLNLTLQPVDLGYRKTQFDLSASLVPWKNWTYRAGFSRDVRDGTRAQAGSFFGNASQLVLPVDQVTDQLEVSAAYATATLQAKLAYLISRFDNGAEALTWANPFWPATPGATRAQLALAPDNQLHQVSASLGYQVLPQVRASADFSFGRLTQNAPYLESTLNTVFAPSAVARPVGSLDGRVDTFNGNLRLSAAPTDDWRVVGSLAYNERDNKTGINAYPLIAADVFVDGRTRSNTPFDTRQSRAKLQADYRGLASVKLTGGLEHDQRERSYTEAVTTKETTAWAQAAVQPRDALNLSLKLSHGDRTHSSYGTAQWFGLSENPLLRKYNLAARRRDSSAVRVDWGITETIALGLNADFAQDSYHQSTIGLQRATSYTLGADVSAALSERTSITAYAQAEELKSRQAGSESAVAGTWTAHNKDRFNVLGLGVRHAVIPEKFEVALDITRSRSKGDVTVLSGTNDPGFPQTSSALDSIKLRGTYKLSDKLSLTGQLWHESFHAEDWQTSKLMPASVVNLLALGQDTAHYRVQVVSLALRYRF